MTTHGIEVVDDFPIIVLGPGQVWHDARLHVATQHVVNNDESRRNLDFEDCQARLLGYVRALPSVEIKGVKWLI